MNRVCPRKLGPLVLCALWAAPAWAAEPQGEPAEETPPSVYQRSVKEAPSQVLMHQAMTRRRLGDYAEAVRLLEAAYRQSRQPSYIYLIGETEQEAGRAAEALAAYRRYLKLAPPGAPDRAAVQEEIELLSQPQVQSGAAPTPRPHTPAFREEGPGGVAAQPLVALERTDRGPVKVEPVTQPPFYKQWWFWTALGGAAVVGTAVGLGVAYRPAQPSFLIAPGGR